MTKAKRDVGVELARLISCLIVIGVHIKLADNLSGDYDFTRLFISCILADGVAVFWMISGCFLFRTKSYAKLLVRTAKTILVPLLVLSAILLMFADFLFNGTGIMESLPSLEKVVSTIKGMLTLRPTVSGSGHLWYCYAYILLMLCFPVMKTFSDWLDESTKRQNTFLIISFGLFLFNDLSKNASLSFSHHAFNAVVPAAILIIWGNIIYKNKEKFLIYKDKKISPLVYLLGFMMVNILRTTIILLSKSRSLLYWYTVFGILSASFLILMCISIAQKIKENSLIEKGILGIASYTFMIYLLHIPLRNILNRFSFNTLVFDFVSSFTSGAALSVVYTLLTTVMLFTFTLIIAVILRSFTVILKKLFVKQK